MRQEISIPHNFDYRPYQKGVVEYLRSGGKRSVTLWHRRAGKDKTYFNLCVEMALKTVGGYAYILPTYAQGKKIIWDSIDREGKKFRDHVPPMLLSGENGTELKFTLLNGSFIQILGSDNIDSIRGISPKGIVFSEYAFQNPEVWEVMRPILAENGGWAIFNSTPNGKNHFYDMCNLARDNADWFFQKLTVEDTLAVGPEYIQSEREQGMTEEMIQQEYYCSFDIGALGSYYAKQITQAREEGRITSLPLNRDVPIDMHFDLGVNDSFTISFHQKQGQFENFLNYYEDTGKTLEHYFSYMDEYIERKGAKIGNIFLPHDANQKGHSYLVSGVRIIDKFREKYGSHKVKMIDNKLSINDGIQEARKVFPNLRFDEDTCQQFIRCIENYKKDFDEKKKVFRDQPYHDWASHGADNLRYFAISPRYSKDNQSTLVLQDHGLDYFLK